MQLDDFNKATMRRELKCKSCGLESRNIQQASSLMISLKQSAETSASIRFRHRYSSNLRELDFEELVKLHFSKEVIQKACRCGIIDGGHDQTIRCGGYPVG